MTPLERRPTLEISATNAAGVTPMIGVTHGTEVTVVAVTFRDNWPDDGAPSTPGASARAAVQAKTGA